MVAQAEVQEESLGNRDNTIKWQRDKHSSADEEQEEWFHRELIVMIDFQLPPMTNSSPLSVVVQCMYMATINCPVPHPIERVPCVDPLLQAHQSQWP